MKWAILEWHPSMTGASWVKGKFKETDKRAKVLIFNTKEEAETAAANMYQYPGMDSGLEVLEYNI